MPGSSGNVTSGDTKSGDTNSKNNNSKDNGSKNADGNKSEDTQPNGNNAGGNNSGSTNVNTGGGAGGGTPGGTSGGGNTASSIEGITWKSETTAGTMTLRLNGGNVKATFTTAGQTVPDNGTYTVSGDTIQFTGFTLAAYLNREFKYKVEGDTFTLLDKNSGGEAFQFKKEKK